MRLSILIATIGRRNTRFIELVGYLTKLAKGYDVEIIAYWNNGEESIGKIRQSLIESAIGDYVCFVDDDDWVPDYYLAEIFKAMGKDYIGFQVELFEKDKQLKPVFHSIRYGVWHDDNKGFYRGITHLNPIRRQLALLGDFANQGIGEDANWARSLAGKVQTEAYIDKIMYYYFHDADKTTFGGPEQLKQEYTRPGFKHPKFRYHPKSKQKGEM